MFVSLCPLLFWSNLDVVRLFACNLWKTETVNANACLLEAVLAAPLLMVLMHCQEAIRDIFPPNPWCVLQAPGCTHRPYDRAVLLELKLE